MSTATHRCLLRGIKGLSGELSQEAYLTSWMGHFGTETIHSLFDRFSLSNSVSTLNLTNTLFVIVQGMMFLAYSVTTVVGVPSLLEYGTGQDS